jgi:urease accessory protein
MSWLGRLDLSYEQHAHGCVLHHRQTGPLRVLKSLYPEGPEVCHNVLVHPPSGLVGGDRLEVHVDVQAHARALITTPGATRFYRSTGQPAVQQVSARVSDGARLEWLPLETIAYTDCLAENHLSLRLAPTAEAMVWDTVTLGLPSAGDTFAKGQFTQHMALDGVWLERARLNGADQRLLQSPLGLNGHKTLSTLMFSAGQALSADRAEDALLLAREIVSRHPMQGSAGVTSPHPQVIVLRALSPMAEPARDLLQLVWSAWRHRLWGCDAHPPRIWAL